MNETSTVRLEGGWMEFSVSDKTLVLNYKIRTLLGIDGEAGWNRRYIDTQISLQRLEEAKTLASKYKARNERMFDLKQEKKRSVVCDTALESFY